MSALNAAALPGLVLVAAIGENNVIGRDNQLPWRVRSDLQHFKSGTHPQPGGVGPKTHETIGKPLKDRPHIVSTPAAGPPALLMARDDARKRGAKEIMVIGGADLFNATLPVAQRLEITHVHAAPEGDVFFPPIDPAVWRQTMLIEHPAGPDDSAPFAIATYVRR